MLASLVSSIWGGEETNSAQPQENDPVVDQSKRLCETPGRLNRYDPRNEDWIPLDNIGEVRLVAAATDDQFLTQLVILARNPDHSDKLILMKNLTDDLQLRFDSPSNSLNFIITSETNIAVYQFVFSNTSEENDVKRLLAIKLIESNYRQDFTRLCKPQEDEEWFVGAQEEGAMDVDHEGERWEDEEEEVKGFQKAAQQPLSVPASNEPALSNKQLDDSMVHNRMWVLQNEDKGSNLSFYTHGERPEDLENQGYVTVSGTDGKRYHATKMQSHHQDSKMLFLTEENPNEISLMDLARGQVVEHWSPGKGDIRDLAPLCKYDQRTPQQLLKVVTKKGYCTIDPRTKGKTVEFKDYKSGPDFSAICTTGLGQFATGSADGSIRLYNKTTRAKTLLPGLGSNIKHIEVTEDGKWILATCRTYLVLVPTTMPDGSGLGFDVRMGKNKPKPLKLMLKAQDMMKFGISKVDFTPARFDAGETDETCIVTSTGPFVVKFDFNRAKKGYLQDYLISKRPHQVVNTGMRFNRTNELVVAESQDVYAKRTQSRVP